MQKRPPRRRRPTKTPLKLVSATVSSVALDELFESEREEDLAIIDALYARMHRTALWKYRKRRRRPDLDTANMIESVTGGRIRAGGWSIEIDTPGKAA